MRKLVFAGLIVALVMVAVALTATGMALAQGPLGGGQRGPGGMMGPGGMGGGMMGPGMGPGMGGPRPTPEANQPYDLRFLDEMMAHHQMGVRMTQHMAQDSARPEMRDLAQRIITAQQAEIAQMQQWRQQWYPNAPRPRGMGGMMGGMMDGGMMQGMMGGMMGQMMGQTMDRDRMFLQMMIPHHEDAVEMAQAALQQAQHSEIKTLAQAIITAQQAEISEMRGYLRDWYGIP